LTDYLHFQTIIQIRIPLKDDGTPGNPEVVSRFTSPYKGAQGFTRKKAVKKVKKEVTLKAEKRETLEI